MCEWLSVLSAETVEKGESGGSGVPGRPPHLPWYIPLPTPISSPAPPGHLLPLGSSPGLAPILQPSLPIFQSGGDLMPGTFYIPFRAACYSLLQLHCVHCILPSCPGLSAQPSGSTQPTAGYCCPSFRDSQGGPPVTRACPFPASGFMRSSQPAVCLLNVCALAPNLSCFSGTLSSLWKVVSLQGQAALKLLGKPAHWQPEIPSHLSKSRL